jgi:deoxyribonuclease-4
MVRVGVHVSIGKGIDTAVDNAVQDKCDTFQIFTRNPQGWKFSDLDPEEVKLFRKKMRETGIGPAVDHMPYLPNLASPMDEIYEKSVATFVAEVERCVQLGVAYLVVHLGSHLGAGRELGLRRIGRALNEAVKFTDKSTMILLENTAGARNSMGSNFSDVKDILNTVKRKKDRIGVCLDTCHCYAAGMDLHTEKGVNQTLSNFDSTIGFENLKVIHLNDSRGGLGSGSDRHEHIGMGYIGTKGFKVFLHNEAIRELPWILETPEDERCDDAGNIQMVRKLAK